MKLQNNQPTRCPSNQNHSPPENSTPTQENEDQKEDDDEHQPRNLVPVFRLAWDDEDEEDEEENLAPAASEPGDQQENIVLVSREDEDQREDCGHEHQESDEPSYVDLDVSFLPDGSAIVYMHGVGDIRMSPEALWSWLLELGLENYLDNLWKETILHHLKTRKYQLDKNQEENEEPELCVVCQSPFENEEILGTLECGHEYHADCFKRWLEEKNVCPICKHIAI